MSEPIPSLFTRLAIALRAFFNSLINPQFALAVEQLNQSPQGPQASQPVIDETDPVSALQLLSLLQRDGRLIDFLEEDVTQYADAEIGAAVRVVHEGCRKVLQEHFVIEPVLDDPEGSRTTLALGFDATAIRPTGKVVGEPPFDGVIAHRGWRATQVKLPRLAAGHDTTVLAAAEVEL